MRNYYQKACRNQILPTIRTWCIQYATHLNWLRAFERIIYMRLMGKWNSHVFDSSEKNNLRLLLQLKLCIQQHSHCGRLFIGQPASVERAVRRQCNSVLRRNLYWYHFHIHHSVNQTGSRCERRIHFLLNLNYGSVLYKSLIVVMPYHSQNKEISYLIDDISLSRLGFQVYCKWL